MNTGHAGFTATRKVDRGIRVLKLLVL